MSDPDPIVNDEERELFDDTLERVLKSLPEHLIKLIDEVPLVVEDYPSDEVLREMGAEDPADLCGLHSGIPLTERSVSHSGQMPEMILIYREGILQESVDDEGYIDLQALHEQIRITLLHEIGHHFGLDEDELEKLGYG